MNYTIIDANIMTSGHTLGISANGNKYYISLHKGGCYWNGFEDFADEKFATCHSGDFATWEAAFAAFSRLLNEFGQGNYSWEDRCEMVKEAK